MDGTKVAEVEIQVSSYVWHILWHVKAVSLLSLNNEDSVVLASEFYVIVKETVLVTDGND